MSRHAVADPALPPIPEGYAVETHIGTPPVADLTDRAWSARRMSTDAPSVTLRRTVRTWNAVENAHLLAVNRAMGFQVNGHVCGWQKTI